MGGTHQAAKTVMRWTGASEWTVKNWFAGSGGPSGQHLIALAHHSDEVLATFLVSTGRQKIVAAIELIDVQNRIAEVLLGWRLAGLNKGDGLKLVRDGHLLWGPVTLTVPASSPACTGAKAKADS